MPGRFYWYELFTRDVPAAVDFYTRVAGWDTAPWSGADTPYTMWMANGNPLGGVMPLTEEMAKLGAPSHWLAYVEVADADTAVRRAVGVGATVLSPAMDIPEVGRLAVLSDPQGAVFAFFTAAGPAQNAPAPPRVGEIGWNELGSPDLEGAWGFYSAAFGWEKTADLDRGPDGLYRMFKQRGTGWPIGAVHQRPASAGPPGWTYSVRVGDLDAAAARVRALGGTILQGPMDAPGGDRVVRCRDPQGAVFALQG